MNGSNLTRGWSLKGAESAFKRLSEAYQCLVDKASQCIYLHQLLGQQSKHTRQKFKQKKKPFFKPKSATEPRLPKHARTPEEIWQIFQREEEEAARQDFYKKGFDRMYEETFPETKQNAKDASLRTEKQQQILDSCLDIKSKKWVAWTQPNCKRKRTETLIPEPAPATKDVAPSSIDCLLCRRTFSSLEILRKHEQFSKLHIANLSNKL